MGRDKVKTDKLQLMKNAINDGLRYKCLAGKNEDKLAEYESLMRDMVAWMEKGVYIKDRVNDLLKDMET